VSSKHWNEVYSQKTNEEMSWFQEMPHRSLELITELSLKPDTKIIDIGGGDSKLTDSLLELGYNNLSVLDISKIALEKMRVRLGQEASKVQFIESDVTLFAPNQKYGLWHDRATFHFLTMKAEVEKYIQTAFHALGDDGYLIVSTFSKTGPEKCSGLTIARYADVDLKELFGKYFENIKCVEDTHETPWGTKQDFVYCGFKKR
jgi:ubiquinone/menaquinone biosynthesis C-methylase UbiE